MFTERVQSETLKVRDVTSEAVINDQMHLWVREMTRPMLSERKLKGALAWVSREMGITYSYTRKCFYGWERAEPKASRYERAKIAYHKWFIEQRGYHQERIERIDKLKEQFGPPGEHQIALDL